MNDGYTTLFGFGEAEFTEKRSRFIGQCARAETEAEALAFIESVRKKHPAATHNVYAYSLRGGNLSRYSDDGEPQGTAGLPLLTTLTGGGIIDAAIVVTRYFGGTLLGTGGLVRAYSRAASQAVSAAGVARMERRAVVELNIGYSEYDPAVRLLESVGASGITSDFSGEVRIEASIPFDSENALAERLRELTRGTREVKKLREEFAAALINQQN